MRCPADPLQQRVFREARVFKTCDKCGGYPPLRPLHEHIEVAYYRRPRPGDPIPMEATTAPPAWVNDTVIENIEPGKEGFFIRCCRCKHVWYESMEII